MRPAALSGADSADPVSKKLSALGYPGFQVANPRAARPKILLAQDSNQVNL